MNATLTLGGLVVGAALHIREFAPAAWATVMKKSSKGESGQPAEGGGKFNLRAHAPFLLGDAIGMLAISCPGGFVGTAAAKALGISNSIGDKALSSGVGGQATLAAQHAAHTMDQYGAAIVLLLIITVIVLRKALPKPQKKQLAAGVWSGSTLGLSSAAAGLTAAVLIPLVEQAGHALGGQA